jgi:hypothetical protein
MEILGRNNKKSTNICCIIRKQYVIDKIACDDTIAVSLNCPFLISLSVFSNNYYKTRYIFLSGCADLFTFKENSIVLRDTIDYELYNFCKLTVKVNMNEHQIPVLIVCTKCTFHLYYNRSVVSSTNKTNRHDITEILLEVALNIIKKPKTYHIISSVVLKTKQVKIQCEYQVFMNGKHQNVLI